MHERYAPHALVCDRANYPRLNMQRISSVEQAQKAGAVTVLTQLLGQLGKQCATQALSALDVTDHVVHLRLERWRGYVLGMCAAAQMTLTRRRRRGSSQRAADQRQRLHRSAWQSA